MSIPERNYNIGLLDDIHNFFPEILYDSQLFPSDTNSLLSWIRFRMTILFPQNFRRGRLNYEQRYMVNVRADYEEWLFLTRVMPPPQIRMPPYRNEFINTNTTIPLYNTFFNSINQAAINQPLFSPPQPPLAQNLVNQVNPNYRIWGGEDNLSILGLALSFPTENWLASFFDSIPIVPTPAEIEAGSQILQNTSILEDVICTICQEHDQSPRETVWRKINSCSHIFHKHCIDRWFTRNSHCPVCRFDIRAPPLVNPAVAPSSAEEDSPM